MKKHHCSGKSLVILVGIAVTTYYFMFRSPQVRKAKLEAQQREEVIIRENAVKRKACLADQASIPTSMRSSGTYVDCQAVYP